MNKLSAFFYQRSTWIIALVLTVISFGYLFLVMMDAGKCFEVAGSTPASLGTSFGFDYDTVVGFLTIRTEEMINCYQSFNLLWDNIFAILYGLMYVAWVSFILKPFQNSAKLLNLLPFLQTIFDWVENLQLVKISSSHLAGEQISAFNVYIASAASMLKWVISTLVFVAILVGISFRIMDAVKKKS